jgi:hypothetical protein
MVLEFSCSIAQIPGISGYIWIHLPIIHELESRWTKVMKPKSQSQWTMVITCHYYQHRIDKSQRCIHIERDITKKSIKTLGNPGIGSSKILKRFPDMVPYQHISTRHWLILIFLVTWYPLVNVYIAMENHHAFHGKTHYFDWAIFNSYFDITRG